MMEYSGEYLLVGRFNEHDQGGQTWQPCESARELPLYSEKTRWYRKSLLGDDRERHEIDSNSIAFDCCIAVNCFARELSSRGEVRVFDEDKVTI